VLLSIVCPKTIGNVNMIDPIFIQITLKAVECISMQGNAVISLQTAYRSRQ
jgi:hypothetical protein